MDVRIKKSLNKATTFLMKEQNSDGYWNNGFTSSSLATAIGAIVYAEYKRKSESKKAIKWLLDNQNRDGGGVIFAVEIVILIVQRVDLLHLN
ncbi:hypothetical protein [Methanobacterium ferruginis]|uniref:hypothetical protein n=1 Tax=Methanobacterium ferruginis TaxID=710191 RepID=UPI0025739D5A|nr:hypothetical protein [Methanobacterium ferruginis]BDZ68077.1 hypothetical protein GCM10025860_15250 [Methanobacterium ferruginis]